MVAGRRYLRVELEASLGQVLDTPGLDKVKVEGQRRGARDRLGGVGGHRDGVKTSNGRAEVKGGGRGKGRRPGERKQGQLARRVSVESALAVSETLPELYLTTTTSWAEVGQMTRRAKRDPTPNSMYIGGTVCPSKSQSALAGWLARKQA